MKHLLSLSLMALFAVSASAQENLQRSAVASDAQKSFTVVKQLPITSIKNLPLVLFDGAKVLLFIE